MRANKPVARAAIHRSLETILCSLLMVGCATNLSAAEIDQTELLSIQPAVRYVATGGYWRDSTRSGDYRIIILAFGHDHLAYETYAQWLHYDSESGTSSVLLNQRIDELTDRVGAVVKDPRFIRGRPGAEGSLVDVDLVTEHPPKRTTFTIHLKGPGEYSIEERE